MANRRPFVAGNWKMHKTVAEARQLVLAMLDELQSMDAIDRVVCPPFTALDSVSSLLRESDVDLGAQDMHWETSGAYTGAISPAMVAELCEYVILGHSERRSLFHETDQAVNRKLHAALERDLTPIVCVGETLEENEAGRTREVVLRQVREGLSGLGRGQERLVVAYEPVWAIGTGKAATPEGAEGVIGEVIRPALAEIVGEEGAQAVRVLYGGSIKPDNAREFFTRPEIDGGLVGGASLKAEDFVAISRAALP